MFLILDEAGTHDCRYMVIGGAYVTNYKPLWNKVEKLSLKLKKQHPELADKEEIKLPDMDIREFFASGIGIMTNIEVKYIVADKLWVKNDLKERQNIFINYLMSFFVRPISESLSGTGKSLDIWFDKRSIKTGSLCLKEYLETKIYGDWNHDTRLSVKYCESKYNYAIQGAHHIANAIWLNFEENNAILANKYRHLITYKEHFPRDYFGMEPGHLQTASTMVK